MFQRVFSNKDRYQLLSLGKEDVANYLLMVLKKMNIYIMKLLKYARKVESFQTVPAVSATLLWHSWNLIIFHILPNFLSNGGCVCLCSIIINGNWEHLGGSKPFPRDVISCIKISKHERIHIDMWWIHTIGSINTNGNEAHSSLPHCRGRCINPGASGGPGLLTDLALACSFLCFQMQLDKYSRVPDWI